MSPDEINARRKRLRMSVSELARAARVNVSSLHRIISGGSSPNWSTLLKLDAAVRQAEAEMRSSLAPRGEAP